MSRMSWAPALAVIALVFSMPAMAGCQPDTPSAQAEHHSTDRYARAHGTGTPSASARTGSADGDASHRPEAAGSDAATHTAKGAPSHIAPQHLGVRVSKVRVGGDHRTLTLTYWQDQTACGSAWHPHRKGTTTRIVVWMTYDRVPRRPGQAVCSHLSICRTSCDRTVTLELDNPVYGRAIYDADTGKRLA